MQLTPDRQGYLLLQGLACAQALERFAYDPAAWAAATIATWEVNMRQRGALPSWYDEAAAAWFAYALYQQGVETLMALAHHAAARLARLDDRLWYNDPAHWGGATTE